MESSPGPGDETPTQRQARLRRERRQAKITAQGNDRLNKIMGVQGRKDAELESAKPPFAEPSQRQPSSTQPSKPQRPQNPTVEDAPDPEEMEISAHYYEPRRTPRPQPAGPSPFGLPGGMAMGQNQQNSEDPMMKLMQQLLSGGGEAGGDPNAQLPAVLAQLLGTNPQQAQADAQAQQQPPSDSTYIWRIVHAVASLLLAVYVVISSSVRFTGNKESREQANLGGEEFGHRLFFWFATTEVVLQSSRYFLEGGRVARSGLLGMAASVLPQPYAGYIKLVGRYTTIFSTVAKDALVILFVLGMVAWWNGNLDSN